MKFHSGYITKNLRTSTKAMLMDGISGHNQGYNVVHDPTAYRQIPADILSMVHGLEVELQRLHDRKQLLLKAGWEKGKMPAELTRLMDLSKHTANRAKARGGKRETSGI